MLLSSNRLFVYFYLSPNREDPKPYVAPFNHLTERRFLQAASLRRACSRFD